MYLLAVGNRICKNSWKTIALIETAHEAYAGLTWVLSIAQRRRIAKAIIIDIHSLFHISHDVKFSSSKVTTLCG